MMMMMMHCSHFYPEWFQYSWNDSRGVVHGPRKEPVPHGFDVAKGSTHMAVTRAFVEFAVHDRRAKDLLYWMRNIKMPDEHFFQTLNHNAQMNIPGSFRGRNSYLLSCLLQINSYVKYWSYSAWPGSAGLCICDCTAYQSYQLSQILDCVRL